VAARLLDYLGLDVARLRLRPVDLVKAQTLQRPALNRSRFDVSAKPTRQVPGGMAPELAPQYQWHIEELQKSQTLESLLEQITTTLATVRDDQVPEAIRWASDKLGEIPVHHNDGTTEPLFARRAVHDIRIDPLA
jgi:hypothetical protein